MLSTPPATNTSPSSALIARAAALIAASPEAQRRLKVTAATETGKPARRAAIRATFRLSSPAWFVRRAVIGPPILQVAVMTPHRGPDGSHNYRFRHSASPNAGHHPVVGFGLRGRSLPDRSKQF